MSANSETEFITAYKKIKSARECVTQKFQQAIVLDEKNDQPFEASVIYRECMKDIQYIFNMQLPLLQNVKNVAMEWNDTCKIIEDLKQIEKEVEWRVKCLLCRYPVINTNVSEPADEIENRAYRSRVSSNSFGNNLTIHRQITMDLKELLSTEGNTHHRFNTLFYCQVLLYKINSDGVVQMISGNTYMSLESCTSISMLDKLYFLKCSLDLLNQQCEHAQSSTSENTTDNVECEMIWIFPLLRSHVTCYITEYGAFIFPDLENDGAAYGIIIKPPVHLDENAAKHFQQFFADLLEAVLRTPVQTIYKTQEADDFSASDKVAKKITVGANYLARSIMRTAEKSSQLIYNGTPYIMSKLKPAQENAPIVPPIIQNTAQLAQGATSFIASATSFLRDEIGTFSKKVACYLVPYVQSTGVSLLEKLFHVNKEKATNMVEGAFIVATGASEGFSEIVNTLQKSAALLGNSLSENSVKIIDFKYGNSVSSVAENSLHALGNLLLIKHNVNSMKPKGVANNVLKSTGKMIASQYNFCSTTEYISAGNLSSHVRQN